MVVLLGFFSSSIDTSHKISITPSSFCQFFTIKHIFQRPKTTMKMESTPNNESSRQEQRHERPSQTHACHKDLLPVHGPIANAGSSIPEGFNDTIFDHGGVVPSDDMSTTSTSTTSSSTTACTCCSRDRFEIGRPWTDGGVVLSLDPTTSTSWSSGSDRRDTHSTTTELSDATHTTVRGVDHDYELHQPRQNSKPFLWLDHILMSFFF